MFAERRVPSVWRGIALLTATSLLAGGCQWRGEMSGEGYELARAMITICNLRQQARLEDLAAAISNGESQGRLSPGESRQLQAVLRLARQGDWRRAEERARALLASQQSAPPKQGQASFSP